MDKQYDRTRNGDGTEKRHTSKVREIHENFGLQIMGEVEELIKVAFDEENPKTYGELWDDITRLVQERATKLLSDSDCRILTEGYAIKAIKDYVFHKMGKPPGIDEMPPDIKALLKMLGIEEP